MSECVSVHFTYFALCSSEYYQVDISLELYSVPNVSLDAGVNAVFVCAATVPGNETGIALHWAISWNTNNLTILPPVQPNILPLQADNLTQANLDLLCQERSEAFSFPVESYLGPNSSFPLTEGAVLLTVRAGLLICGATPSLSHNYSCFATNGSQEIHLNTSLVISVGSGVLSTIIATVTVIVVAALVVIVLVARCCYHSKLRKYDFVPMTRRSHLPSFSHGRHSFTNQAFDRYPTHSPSELDKEFDRGKLHFISVLGTF